MNKLHALACAALSAMFLIAGCDGARDPAGEGGTPVETVFEAEPGARVEAHPRIPAAWSGAGERVCWSGRWEQLEGPKLDPPPREAEGTTTFFPLLPGAYCFQCAEGPAVGEQRAILVPKGRDEASGDRRPEAVIPPVARGVADVPCLLDGSFSRDPDGDPLHALWETPDGARGAKLQPLEGLKALFTAPRPGAYAVRFRVSDGRLASAPATLLVDLLDPGRAPNAGETRPELPGPLDRRVTLGLYERSLAQAVELFPARSGLSLRIDPDWLTPDKLKEVPLHFGLRDAPVRLAADWLARQTDAAYRRDTPSSLWLTRPALAVRQSKLESLGTEADALYEAPDGSDLSTLLRELFGGVLRERSDAFLKVDAERKSLMAALPEADLGRLRELLRHLRSPRSLDPPLPPPPPADAAFRRRLGRQSVSLDWRQVRLDEALRKFSEATGVPTGFDPRQFNIPLPKLTLKWEAMPLRQAIRDIAAEAGFDGCQLDPAGAFWFYRGPEPCVSGELLSDTAVVRSYEVEPLLRKLPLASGELLAHLIKSRVFPASWADPAAFCGYHRPSGRLVISHAPEAQARALEVLQDVSLRGEAALGR